MNPLKILLCARVFTVARPRPLVYAVRPLREVRALFRFDLSLFLARGLVQAARGFLSLFGWRVLNAHGFLHRGPIAAPTNGQTTTLVPGSSS